MLSEVHPGTVAVVAEAPGEREVTEGRPLVGRSGQEVMRGLNALGVYRPQVSFANAVACRPPGNEWRMFHAKYVDKPNSRITKENIKTGKENKLRKAQGLAPLPLKPLVPQPIDCCKPQLLQQIERTPNLIVAGVTAYYAITGKRKSIRKIRGSFNDYWLVANGAGQRSVLPAVEGWKPGQDIGIEGFTLVRHLRIVPTLHPAFVLRTPAWRPVFQSDLARFYRWMNGQLKWVAPEIVVAPTPAFLKWFLWNPEIEFHAVDVETDGLSVLDLGWKREDMLAGIQRVRETVAPDRMAHFEAHAAKVKLPRPARLRCVQIGAPNGLAVVIPIRSIDGQGGMERWYAPADAAAVVELTKQFLTDPSRAKVGHNHLYFDNAMFKLEWDIEVQNLTDTMVLFRGAASELRRDLYTLGTIFTDVPDWKTGGDERNASVNPRSDRDLHVYGAIDVHVTAQVTPPLVAAVHVRGQAEAMKIDHAMSGIAREMKAIGIGRVNETKRRTLEDQLTEKVAKYRASMAKAAGPKWNPRSMADLTTLFCDDWGLQPLAETPTGDPSWDDATLRAYRQAKILTPEQLALIDDLRAFRTADKQLGTYVRPWRRWNDYRRTSTGRLVGGMVGPDGRLHGDYSVCAPKTGRISSSGPNCFDGETEVLTREAGWVRFDVAAQNPGAYTLAQWSEHRGIEFVHPTAWHRRDFHGKMVHLKNQHIDLLVTPDHRCLLQNRKRGNLQVFTAREYKEDWKQLQAGVYAGGPGLDCNIPLLLAVQADGSLIPTESGKWDLTFAFKKARKIEQLRVVLSAAGVDYSESEPRKGVTAFYIPRGQDAVARVADLLDPGRVGMKCFGPWLLEMSRGQMDQFLEQVFLWDGLAARGTMYSSSVPGNTDWVQIILTLSNQRAKVRVYPSPWSGLPNWQTDNVGYNFSLTTNIERSEVPWNGPVYCVSVPSSYIVVRRNGRASITGQCQNVIDSIRALVEPEEGHVYAAADYDQIELRLVAAIAGLQGYLKVFARDGADPHAVTAILIYGKTFEAALQAVLNPKQWAEFKATGIPDKPTDERERALKLDDTDPEGSFRRGLALLREEGQSFASEQAARDAVAKIQRLAKVYKQLRVFAKTFVYAVIYGGTANTVYESVSAAEDPKTGKLLFPDMTIAEVRAAYNSFMTNAPELKGWWEATWEFARRNGYVAEPLTGYRRDFPEFERNEILNLPVQGAAAKIMGKGMIRLRARIAPGQFGPNTGIVAQVHDFGMAEVPEARGAWACEQIRESFTMVFPQLKNMPFPATPKTAPNWMAA